MSVLVDTSLLIGSHRIDEVDQRGWAISAITVGELEAGVLLADEPSKRAGRLRQLSAVLAQAPVLPVDRAVADRYAELRRESRRSPTNDLWIAATALAHDLTLITADRKQAKLPRIDSLLIS